MSTINNGLAQINIGAIASDGGMGTTLARLGDVKEGSFKVNHAEGDKTEFKIEESDTPIFIRQKDGTLSFEFEIHNPDGATFKQIWGGTVDATTGKYTPPEKLVPVEMSFQVKPDQGHGFDVPRAQVAGRFSDAMGKDSLLGVIVTATVLKPTKAGISNFEMPKYPLATTP
ncbi:hypothetical protein M2T79_18510 [Elizabethkingia miricola]|uniref:hypothetical protein n=1 Tax=Elizabethkingia miricola TaxID=172045 RepID=UPI002019E945|nr:hypothetical protein [Elizabethkingia miricola]ELB0069470.1 hypothetical protein [Elizabethkingia anophelis]ELB1894297.1 hypothetical protein [Elizabethkingia anophelis]MCL1658603.1 hypothetical protein [Elizabethkingia miricola]MCT4142978.1 hypothetical protein [Elizabethkingia anophelis]MCT4156055.1 hypothetical protein [Elizabethkingia anophelis]